MRLCIVPNDLSEKIYRKVDAAIAECPELTDQRENVYQDILAFFDEHGYIPDFTLKKTEAAK